jgi:hypothetical protein
MGVSGERRGRSGKKVRVGSNMGYSTSREVFGYRCCGHKHHLRSVRNRVTNAERRGTHVRKRMMDPKILMRPRNKLLVIHPPIILLMQEIMCSDPDDPAHEPRESCQSIRLSTDCADEKREVQDRRGVGEEFTVFLWAGSEAEDFGVDAGAEGVVEVSFRECERRFAGPGGCSAPVFLQHRAHSFDIRVMCFECFAGTRQNTDQGHRARSRSTLRQEHRQGQIQPVFDTPSESHVISCPRVSSSQCAPPGCFGKNGSKS